MNRRVILPMRFASPTWGLSPPCKQALIYSPDATCPFSLRAIILITIVKRWKTTTGWRRHRHIISSFRLRPHESGYF